MRSGEERLFLELHHAAVRGLAVEHYPEAVINAWAPLPVTEGAVARVAANPDRELRFIAEVDGNPAGLAALVAKDGELRACYVAPDFCRHGVGRALIAAVERAADEAGLASLWLDASTNAVPFYRSLGYDVDRPATHRLAAGVEMACFRMSKTLAD